MTRSKYPLTGASGTRFCSPALARLVSSMAKRVDRIDRLVNELENSSRPVRRNRRRAA